MTYKFNAELTAEMDISDKEFQMLLEAAKNHYDYTVQSIGQVGGFLYGMGNRSEFSNGTYKKVEATGRNWGLILKSLEIVNTDAGRFIGNAIFKMLEHMYKQCDDINKSMVSHEC